LCHNSPRPFSSFTLPQTPTKPVDQGKEYIEKNETVMKTRKRWRRRETFVELEVEEGQSNKANEGRIEFPFHTSTQAASPYYETFHFSRWNSQECL